MRSVSWILLKFVTVAVVAHLVALASFAADRETVVILKTAERIQEQERRQMTVSRNLESAVDRINLLLADLGENQLMDKGSGEAVAKLSESLVKLNRSNVPQALTHLSKAQENLKAAYPHLDSAEKEVLIIIKEMDLLLKEAGSALVLDVLIAQVQELIRTESFVKGETTQWGKQMFINPKEAEIDKNRLATAQQEVQSRLTIFANLLQKATGETSEATLKNVFVNAQSAMNKSNPDMLLKSALAGINEKKVINAVGFQDKSLLALQEIEQILTTPIEVITPSSLSTATELVVAAAAPDAGATPMPGTPMPGTGDIPLPGMGDGRLIPFDPQPKSDIGHTSDTTIGGSPVTQTISTDRALAKKKRDAAIQKYVQKILPEFRKEVAEYYEVIAE